MNQVAIAHYIRSVVAASGLSALLLTTSPLVPPVGASALPEAVAPPDSAEFSMDPMEGLLFGISEQRVEFHGFINAEGYAFQKQAEHSTPSFDLHNFFFAARAPISADLTLFGELEYEHGATIRLDRCFVDWTLHPLLTLRFGRFYVPLSYERPHYWAPIRLMTSRPMLVDIPFHEWADTGIEIYGHRGWLGYDFCLVNGPFALTESGIPITEVRDNNRGKVPVFKLTAAPGGGLEAGAAYSRGTYDTRGALHFELFELDARLHRGPLDIWTEYDRRTGDDEPGDPADPHYDPLFTGDRAKKSGYYILVGYVVAEGHPQLNYLKPLVRLDRYKVPGVDSDLRRLTLGLNWSPQPHFVVKTEYQWTDEVRGPHLRNNGFMASFVVDF